MFGGKIISPPARTLRRIAGNIAKHAELTVYAEITEQISAEMKVAFDNLVKGWQKRADSLFAHLKQSPPDPKPKDIIEYIERNVVAGLAKLARHVFFVNHGVLKTNDYEEIMNKASSLSFVSNAILLWNTAQLQRIVEELRDEGYPVDDEDLARISPLRFENDLAVPHFIDIPQFYDINMILKEGFPHSSAVNPLLVQ